MATQKITKQLTELIGNTPLLELNKFSENKGLSTPLIAKIEFFNPGGSVKDRIALAMIEDCGKERDSETRSNHHRTDQRQHRCRTGSGQCRKGLPPHPHHAGDHEY